MNKLTALETFKVDVVVQETIDKLMFLDTLKSNMGQEMSEMMSEEISRVMTEQRNLEKKYAKLGQQRAQLKGLKNKQELQETIEEINKTAKELKESTNALCRVLRDNPDISGNQAKIRDDRYELQNRLSELLLEIKDLSFGKFKGDITTGLENMQKLDKLRKEEKEYQTKIKQINTERNEKQKESTAEFEETQSDIKMLEKSLNDAKTDSELFLRYLESDAQGKQDCQLRLFQQEENDLEDKIKDLEDRIEREDLVSNKIKDFLREKKDKIEKESEAWDDKKDKEIERLTKLINDISNKKSEDESKQEEVDSQLQFEMAELEAQKKMELEKERELQRKKEENIARDNAARYLQQKWIWWKTVGKAFSKKGRKKGGKKKKKK